MTFDPVDGARPTQAQGTRKHGAVAKPGSANHDAWLKEMEKQELAAWLRHGQLPVAQHAPHRGATPARPFMPSAPAAPGRLADGEPGINNEDVAAAHAAPARQAAPVDADSGHVMAFRPGEQPGVQAAQGGAAGESQAGPSERPEAAPAAGRAGAVIDGPVAGLVVEVFSQAQRHAMPSAALPAAASPPCAPGLQGRAQGAPVEPLAVTTTRLPALPPVPGRPPGQGAESHATRSSAEEGGPQRTAAGHQAAGERPPSLRVHTSWSEQGVRIWIGADQAASLSDAQLAFALQDLKRLLRQQGITLESVTLNGDQVLAPAQDESSGEWALVHEDSTFVGEPPAVGAARALGQS